MVTGVPLTVMSHRDPAPNLRRAILNNTKTRITVGPLFSEGARLLWGLLDGKTVASVGDIAARVGLDASAVQLHLYGDRRPIGATQDAYTTALLIPPATWTMPPTEPFVLPALAAMADKARAVLTAAGGDGLDIGALGEACAFAPDPYERAFLALSTVYLTGVAESIPGTGRFRLVQTRRAMRAA